MASLDIPLMSDPVRKVNVEDAITDLQLMNVAQEIGPESWRLVGLELGFREPELAHIERDHRFNLVECTYHMLIKWRQDQTDASAALNCLRDALCNAKLGAVARKLNRGSAYHLDFMGRDDILNKSPGKSDGFNVRQLRRELENKYQSHLCTTRLLPWDSRSRVAVDRYFTEIGISLEDTSVRQHTRTSLERHRHDIFTISAMKNLPTNRILLQGKPGSGKSTLVAKLALDWMSRHPKSPLKDLPLLFILPLQKLDGGSNLGEAIKEHLLPEDTTFTAEAIDTFLRTNPDEAMVILDGLDELKKGNSGGDKVGNLFKIIENKRLTECTVMVTSRHWKVVQMKESVLREYTLLEMEGFKVEDTFSYILTYFQEDETMAQGLIRHLEASPLLLEGICPYPLFCTIVCHLWENDIGKTGGGDRLGTHSHLTDQILSSLWTHHESKHTEQDIDRGFDRPRLNSEATHQSRISSICRSFRRMNITRKWSRGSGIANGLPTQSMKSTMCRLGKVALEKLLSAELDLAFQPKDLAICRSYTEIGIAVGLLTEGQADTTSLGKKSGGTRDETCVQFFHKETMQKCAAVFLASLWKKNHGKFEEVLKQLKNKFVAEQYEVLLMLACGEDANVAKEIIQHLCCVNASHNLILKCYFESPEDTLVDGEIIQIFQDYIAISNPESPTISALRYFLKKKATDDNVEGAIQKLLISAAPLSSMQGLVDMLNAEHCPKVSSVSLSWCDLENTNTPALLYALGQLPALSDLTMTGSTIGPSFIENIGRLPPGCFKQLSIMELPIGTTCADAVLRSVFWSGQFPFLQKVYITIQDICSDSTQHKHDEQDQQRGPSTQLKKLSLNCSKLALQASIRFADTLTNATSLKNLSLVSCTFHAEFFRRLGEVPSMKKAVLHMETWKNFELDTFLNKCSKISHLEINSPSSVRNEDVEHKLQVLAKVIPSMPSLTTFHVSVGVGCNFIVKRETIVALCLALKECKKLSRLIISGIKMTTQQGIDILNTCHDGPVRVVSFMACFAPAEDLTRLKQLRDDMNQEKTMVVEF